MKEIDIVKKVSEIMGIKFSHYDNHNMTLDYFRYELKSKPKIVVYSSKYGPWEFAILEDMTVITVTSGFIDTLKLCFDTVGITDDTKEKLSKILEEEKRIEEAENFLKENDCASVINDKNKKINWV